MSDVIIVLGMVMDLLTGGDPTLPAGAEHLAPFARLLALIYDLVLLLAGR